MAKALPLLSMFLCSIFIFLVSLSVGFYELGQIMVIPAGLMTSLYGVRRAYCLCFTCVVASFSLLWSSVLTPQFYTKRMYLIWIYSFVGGKWHFIDILCPVYLIEYTYGFDVLNFDEVVLFVSYFISGVMWYIFLYKPGLIYGKIWVKHRCLTKTWQSAKSRLYPYFKV